MKGYPIALALGLLVLAAAASADEPGNPHPFDPDMRPPSTDIIGQTADLKRAVGELNDEIDAARRRFWKAYPDGPDGPDFAAAEAAFANALWQKNGFYLMISLPEGVTGHAAKVMNVLNYGPGVTVDEYRRKLHSDPTLVDGGINRSAYPLFVQWVNALRREAGAKKDGDLLIDSRALLAKAMTQRSSRRTAYERAQNWAEVLASGVDLQKHFRRELYIQLILETKVSLRLGEAMTDDIPDCQAATVALYDTLVKIMGEKEVVAAADTVWRAPKTAWGDLATAVKVEIGTNVGDPSPDVFDRFFTVLTGSNPRNYAIALKLDQYGRDAVYANKDKWIAAETEYNKLVAKFGESNVLAAAAKLKSAQKQTGGAIRGDPVTPLLAWFDKALADPKAVIPDGQLPHFKASSFNPRWLGKYLAVRGTVLRVDVAEGHFPPWATIHFKESPDNKIVGYSAEPRMLQSCYGADFAGLVGKPVEIWGYVSKRDEGAGVQIYELGQIKLVDAGFGAGEDAEDSKPGWLTAELPPEVLVDAPDYLAWKKFAPGTKVTHVHRLFTEVASGSNQYRRSNISRTTYQLDSIDDKQAVVSFTSIVWHGPEARPQRPGKSVYPAKMTPPTSAAAAPNESGEETLEISGKKIATRWQSVWEPEYFGAKTLDPQTFTKTWVSDQVPGGLVRTRHQTHTNISDKPYRSIEETILQPDEGVEPELSGPAASGRVPTNQPAAKPASVSAPQPQQTPVVTGTPPARTVARPALPPDVAAQAALMQRYNAVMVRAGRAKQQLLRMERPQAGQGTELPADVRDARSRLDDQLKAALGALSRRDNDQAGQNLQSAEDTLSVIEKFLNQ